MSNLNIKSASGEIGETIPPNDIHAISVSLPTWESTLGWASRDPVVVDRMRTGYPRFFIHRLINELADKIVVTYQDEHGISGTGQLGILFPSAQYADACERFLKRKSKARGERIKVITVGLSTLKIPECLSVKQMSWTNLQLHAVIYPAEDFPLAKSFWQHTGYGISSRYAEFCLKYVDHVVVICLSSCCASKIGQSLGSVESQRLRELRECIADDLPPGGDYEECKKALLKRIVDLHPSSSGVTPEDVLLYQTGMCAFTNVAEALKRWKGEGVCEVVCYGFLYVDTFKVLGVLQINTTLHGHASSFELESLESYLQSGKRIQAIVVEVLQNPLLGSPDLRRIRDLANKYEFMIIVDDTISTAVNQDVLAFADVIVTSLSKMFSGACNVMGGSVVVNPKSHFASEMRRILWEMHIDSLFSPDLAILELNSRNFIPRVKLASQNAALVADILRSHPSVQIVYYPKHSPTQHFYDEFRKADGGYSFLLSVVFKRDEQAIRFFDALDVAKGPSLGTNFTLACPYTLLAHYGERDWAKGYGVGEYLVRISVGLEDEGILRGKIGRALEAAEGVGS